MPSSGRRLACLWPPLSDVTSDHRTATHRGDRMQRRPGQRVAREAASASAQIRQKRPAGRWRFDPNNRIKFSGNCVDELTDSAPRLL
jgi:hypothetical protein